MKKFVIGNWKMNGSYKICEEFLNQITSNLLVQTVICPPFLYIQKMIQKIQHYEIGAQNCSEVNNGATTGDISCEMLSEMQVRYVIVGHSERRKYHHESFEKVIGKIHRCIEHNLTPIVCIENVDEIQYLLPFENKILIAYEPITSIGTGIVPSNEEITTIFNRIKDIGNFKTLYGGSVNSQNIKKLTQILNLDGVLVGGASLCVNEFNLIIQSF